MGMIPRAGVGLPVDPAVKMSAPQAQSCHLEEERRYQGSPSGGGARVESAISFAVLHTKNMWNPRELLQTLPLALLHEG